ncbi:hypothetical protein N7456_006275 [Penicillium angulare]|uniref:Uncharacterized protein n=1 Tax=Penicillium angulare TaxID=116970 RepID=A0A9W9FHA8_9EURO|nr:hypothetical protein N7456_006275 [Penicillium angulare]
MWPLDPSSNPSRIEAEGPARVRGSGWRHTGHDGDLVGPGADVTAMTSILYTMHYVYPYRGISLSGKLLYRIMGLVRMSSWGDDASLGSPNQMGSNYGDNGDCGV